MQCKRIARYLNSGAWNIVRGDFEVSWGKIKPSELLIWDEVGSHFILDELVPSSFVVLQVRRGVVYLHPAIVWRTLIRARFFRRGGHYESIVDICAPKAVVTFIDNSAIFHRIAVKFPKIPFVSIQNGARFPMYPDQTPPIGTPSNFSSIYLCFGQNEIDAYARLGYKFNRIKAVGSLRNAVYSRLFKSSRERIKHPEDFDIVLISQFDNAILGPRPPLILAEYENVVRLLSTYAKSHPTLKIGVLLRTETEHPDHNAELDFHHNIMAGHVDIVPKNDGWVSNYYATEQSEVVLASSSTLGFESLSRGCKTLMCSAPLVEKFKADSHFPDWCLNDIEFKDFDDKLSNLLRMPNTHFIERNMKSINYFIRSPQEGSISDIFQELL